MAVWGAPDAVCLPAYTRNNPTSKGLYSWPWQLIAPTKFKVRRWHTFCFTVSASIGLHGDINLCPLTFWPRTWCALLPVRWATFLTIWCFGDFSFSTYGPSQHLSGRPCDLATLTFNLGAHGACQWYGSSCFICLPSLKFVSFPLRKTWHTFISKA